MTPGLGEVTKETGAEPILPRCEHPTIAYLSCDLIVCIAPQPPSPGKVTPGLGEVTKETGSDEPVLPEREHPTIAYLSCDLIACIATRPPSPASGQTPPIHTGINVDDTIPDETVTVPSKRGRSPVGEDSEPTSNKRPRGRPRSISIGSDRGKSERVVSHIPPAERGPMEDIKQGPENTTCSEAAEQDGKTVKKRSQHKPVSPQKQNGKAKSYVTALLGR